MFSSSQKFVFRCLAVFIVFLIGLSDASAGRRSLRIDFQAWSEEIPIEQCNGYSPGTSTVLEEGVQFFSGRSLSDFIPYSYCQTANLYEDGLTTAQYLNREIFEDDEYDLASRIGSNTSNSVTAFKYTYLNQANEGFQWTFYYFPDNVTLVGFYSSFDSQSPFIRTDPVTDLWNETYNGEYFCFGPGGFGVSEFGSVCYAYPPPTDERDILISLYNSTNGDGWSAANDWLTGDPCQQSWYGVYCEEFFEEDDMGPLLRVTQLQLSLNNLVGTIPGDLGNIANLFSVDLQDNQISGTIPAALGDLPDLGILQLNDNNLTGSIPAELGNNDLGILDLNGNSLSGAIPAELGNPNSLADLNLSSNMLSGPIPASLGDLDYLSDLDLRWNKLHTPDSALDTFLDARQVGGDWSLTQTVPPVNVTITAAGPTSISVAWDAIEYTDDTGRYRVWYSTSPGGPFSDGGATASKLVTAHTITGLTVDKPYYVMVRTETDSHANNPNDLESEDSEVVNSNKVHADGFE